MTPKHGDRVRMFRVTAQAFPHVLRDGERIEVIDGFPEDAKIVDAGYDEQHRQFYLTVEHESFDPVAEAEIIPTQSVTLERIDEDHRIPCFNCQTPLPKQKAVRGLDGELYHDRCYAETEP